MKTMTRAGDAQLAEQQSSLRYAGAGVTRREFLTATIAAGLVAGVTGPTWAAESNDEMPRRDLGRTGEKISAIGLGGFHIGVPRDDQEGVRLIRKAIDRGINFMDNCWDYHNGGSEERMGRALRNGYRQRVFLMTKIDGRTRAAAAKQMHPGHFLGLLFSLGHKAMLQVADVLRPRQISFLGGDIGV